MDFVAAILTTIGAWQVGNKNKWGFVVFFITGLCWIYYVLATKSTYGLLIAVIPALVMNIINFIKWSKEDATREEETRSA